MARKPSWMTLALFGALAGWWSPPAADAGWQRNGAPAAVAANQQAFLQAAPDGIGGVLMVWEDLRGLDRDIYAQRLDEAGEPQWGSDGVAVCTATGDQRLPQVAPDGSGGAFLTWQDHRGADLDIYAQRVAADGSPQWTPDGIEISTESGDQSEPVIARTGLDRATIAWVSDRLIPRQVYRQIVDGSGTGQLIADGEPVTGTSGDEPRLVSDGNGGVMLALQGASDLEWIGYDSAGAVQGTGTIAPTFLNPDGLSVAPDGQGGMLVTWTDNDPFTQRDIFAERIKPFTGRAWFVTDVCDEDFVQENPRVASDGQGGGYFVWEDQRPTDGVYIQYADSTGATVWAANGIAVDVSAAAQDPRVVSDGAGGCIVVWRAARTLFGPEIYAQRFDANGTELWTPGGTRVAGPLGGCLEPVAVATPQGGVIAAWRDTRSDLGDIYAQRVDQVVHDVADAGPGSLRQAILDANADGGYSAVAFDIPGPGPHTLLPSAALPTITERTHLDGMTEPDGAPNTAAAFAPSNADLRVEILGTAAGPGVNGLEVGVGGSVVRGLVISGFSGDGVQMTNDGDAGCAGQIEGCYIGTDRLAGVAVPNDGRGIVIQGLPVAGCVTIGGDDPAHRNVISGNGSDGIGLVNASLCRLVGNYIGTDASGEVSLPNQGNGVLVDNGHENFIEDNILSGNTAHGVRLQNGSFNTQVVANLIGVTPTWATQGNGLAGVFITAGNQNTQVGWVGGGNTIGGNGTDGVLDGGQATRVVDNWIGTDPGATLDLGNGTSGVSLKSAVAARIGIPGGGNTVAFNKAGILTLGTCLRFRFRENRIYATDDLGIDVDNDGISGPGSCHFIAPPALALAVDQGTGTSVSGSLTGPPSTALTVDIFASDSCNPAGHGDGRRFLGSVTATTSMGGRANFFDNVGPVNPGEVITATVTDDTFLSEKTSEFSVCLTPTQATAAGDAPPAPGLAPLTNAPNPFNPRTTLHFQVPATGPVHLAVYSLAGRQIRTLLDEVRAPGQHAIVWDGRDSAGRRVGSGVYLARLVARKHIRERKLVLVR